MHLGNLDMNQTYTMKKDQEEIPFKNVDSEKDLAVIVDNTLTFTKHISSKIKTANRNLGFTDDISNLYILGQRYILELI